MLTAGAYWSRRRREQRRRNYITHTADPSAGSWTTPTAIVTTGLADYLGGTSAFSIEDDSAVGYETIHHTVAITAAAPETLNWTFQCKIKKDAVAKTTRFPLFRFQFTGGTADTIDFTLDTSTGEFQYTAADPAIIDASLTLDGAWWVLKVGVKSVNEDNTAAAVQIYPAAGASANLATYSAAAVGTITICDPIFTTLENNFDVPLLDPVPTDGTARL